MYRLSMICVLTMLSACATDSAAKNEANTQILKELRENKRQQAQMQKRMRDLETRVDMLARKVSQARQSQLPPLDVVRLPAPLTEAEHTAEIDEYDPGSNDHGEPPIILRLHGDPQPRPPKTLPPAQLGVADSYKKARQLFIDHRYADAAQVFARLAQKHPRHDLADNAVYWQGMCSFELARYTTAIQQLQQVAVRYPQSPKVPDALLTIAQSYTKLGDKISATVYLTQLAQQHPRSEAAHKGQQLLSSIQER